MTQPETPNRWETAQEELTARWRQVLERIDARDEGGILELINAMDEYCDQAIEDRDRGAPPPGVASMPAPETARHAGRCLFCRGFADTGGCFGTLDRLNRAVLAGRWQAARELALEYLHRLQTVRFAPATRSATAS